MLQQREVKPPEDSTLPLQHIRTAHPDGNCNLQASTCHPLSGQNPANLGQSHFSRDESHLPSLDLRNAPSNFYYLSLSDIPGNVVSEAFNDAIR